MVMIDMIIIISSSSSCCCCCSMGSIISISTIVVVTIVIIITCSPRGTCAPFIDAVSRCGVDLPLSVTRTLALRFLRVLALAYNRMVHCRCS